MKLIEWTEMTLDGVISDNGTWGQLSWDEENDAYTSDLLQAADALLLGRVTFEGFAQYWPSETGPIADRLNELPKYVASRTLQAVTEWNGTLLEGNPAEEVAKLKQQPGRSILKFGTGELDRTLLQHKLVDEYHLLVHPVAVGAGQRLFEGIPSTQLKAVRQTTFKSGIVAMVYAPR